MIREDDFGNMSEAQVAILRRIRREHFGEALAERELEHVTELSLTAFDASPETAITPEQRKRWFQKGIELAVDQVMEDIRLGRPTVGELNLTIRAILEEEGQER